MKSPLALLLFLSASGLALGSFLWGQVWKLRALEGIASSAPTELEAQLVDAQNQIDILEGDRETLMQDYLQLLQEGETNAPESIPPPTDLQGRITALRGLPFNPPPLYLKLPRMDYDDAVSEAVTGWLEEEKLDAFNRSYARLGLFQDQLNLWTVYSRLYAGESIVFFDPTQQSLLMTEGFDFDEIDASLRLVAPALSRMLDQQHHQIGGPLVIPENDDQDLALAALSYGTAKWIEETILGPKETPTDGAEDVRDALYGIPDFLRARTRFLHQQGHAYVQARLEAGRTLAELYQNPPRTTREILHPEAAPLPQPAWKDLPLPGEKWTELRANTLGEWAIAHLLDTPEAAQGWRGDRYQTWFQSDEGDQLIWRLRFETEKAAQNFVTAFLPLVEAETFVPAIRESETSWLSEGPRSAKLWRPQPNTVHYIDATSPPLRQRLEAAMSAAPGP
ncbi:MAG: hypothetical protein AAF555_08475 [Verrucomicrobiota bacterium]